MHATSRLLSKIRLDQITTNRVAHEARLSIGAVYRFFPDKQAIFDAIAVRGIEGFRVSMDARMADLDVPDGPAFLAAVIDSYIAFLDEHPDFRTISLGRHISPATKQRQSAPTASGPALVRNFMAESLGVGALLELDLRLRIAAETGEHLIAFAYEQPGVEEKAQVISELKRLLSGYLFGEP
jgi:AcrR family transcriptional regulator